MVLWTRKSVFPHNTSTFPSSKLKVSCGVMAVGSMGGSSSEISAVVKSERVAMLMDGDRVAGDAGIVPVSGATIDSNGGDWGFWGSRSVFGRPRVVATGVVLGSFWPVPLRADRPVVNTGGEGRPCQPLSRRRISSCNVFLSAIALPLQRVRSPVTIPSSLSYRASTQ